jgi:hypothetical protein
VAWNAAICSLGSPEAVGKNRIRGSRRPQSSKTSSSSAGSPGGDVKPPPPIARIVGVRSGRPAFVT